MSGAEFSRPRRLDTIGTAPVAVAIAAQADERAALARRFGLLALDTLGAELTLVRDGDAVTLSGRVCATLAQACVATGEPVRAEIDEPLLIRFVPAAAIAAAEELELGADDCDVVAHDGLAIDLGEAAAESMALAIDPFPRSAGAGAALKAAGVVAEDEVASGAFAGLAALKGRLQG